MMKPIPKRLKKEPLIEAIWQVQFEPPTDRPIGDLLPGMLYAALRDRYPQLQLHRLPTADIPAPVAQIDPNLRYAAKYRMEEAGSPYLFHVGDRVITFNCRKPYVGWKAFKAKIFALIEIVEHSGLVPTPERHALRYIDLITLEPAPDLSPLQITLKVGIFDVQKRPLQMRVELPDDDCLHVVQIAAPAQATLPEGMQNGTVVDLETVSVGKLDSWDAVKAQIEYLHERSKAMFFEHILTNEAVVRMEPEY